MCFIGGEWTAEAALAVVELTHFRTLQAQITGYSETGLPEIRLYSYLSPNVSVINENIRSIYAYTIILYLLLISEYCIYQ